MNLDHLVVTRHGASFGGRPMPCAFGRGGFTATKLEGDGATPLGTLRVTGILYRPDRLPCPAPGATPIRPGDLWSDDPTRPEYNWHVRAPYGGSHERLWRADPLYDIVLTTDWNWPNAVPGHGSAIFLHQWRRPRHPTEGCVAFARRDLVWLAARITRGTPVVIRG